MTHVPREPYWNQLVAHYYDHVHWDQTPAPSIYEWLQREYQGRTSLGARYIHFDSAARAQWFQLRWGLD
jgi:hypothetical protein